MDKVWKLINAGDITGASNLLDSYIASGCENSLGITVARASVLISQNRHSEAFSVLENSEHPIDANPKALGLKAVCLGKLGSTDAALKLFKHALELAPDMAELLHNISVQFGELGRWNESHEYASKAYAKAPKHLLISLNLGRALVNLRRGQEALTVFKRCIKLDEKSAEAWAGFGASHLILNNHQKAIEAIKTAIQYKPESASNNANMGIAYKNVCEYEMAEKFLLKSVALEPEVAEHHWNLSLIMLLRGNILDGWREYEWRYHPSRTAFDKVPLPNVSIPMLKKGDSVTGKTIAILAEQGLGDCIQFARFAKFIQDRGGRVVLLLPDMLAKVFQTLPWAEVVCTSWKNTPRMDAWCFVMSLPHLFADQCDLFEVKTPYLTPYNHYVQKWAAKVNSEKLRVGLVWAGRPTHGNDANRSMKLRDLKKILSNDQVQIYSLQMGEAKDQIAEYPDRIIDLGSEVTDFCDTAGILANLDLLISVDSAPVHIAGAMGVPVWTLVSKVPDFRWGIEGANTPWYDSCTLYRQTKTGDWAEICKKLATDLESFTPQREVKIPALPEMPFEKGAISLAGFTNYIKYAIELQNAGKEAEAQQIYHWGLSVQPNQIDILRNLAVSYRRTGKMQLAKTLYERAIAVSPTDALSYSNYCNLLIDLRELAYADQIASKAISLADNFAPPYYAKSAYALDQKNYADALAFAEKAAALNPSNAVFQAMIGQIYLRQEKYDEAKVFLERAFAISPNHPEALIGVGQYYAAKDFPEKAVEAYLRAEAQRKDLPELYSNLAVALSRINRFEEAIAMARRAIQLQPNYADAHFNLSLYLLTLSRFKEGFTEYEWRYKAERLARDRTVLPILKRPMWQGEDINGKTILVYTEQGHGDCIQFLAYTKVLKEMGATIFVAVKEPLQDLFKSCPWVDKVCYHGETLAAYDYWTLFMSIPYCLGDDKLRPYPGKYLTADHQSSKFDIAPFLNPSKLNVGLVWSGSPTHGGDRWRSVNPEIFSFLTEIESIHLVGINRGKEPQPTVKIGNRTIRNIGGELQDFNELACAIDKIDVLISVDSAPAHLAGALNKMVYTLIPFSPDWRWGLADDRTPLYPNMHLLRQTIRNDWTGLDQHVMRRLGEDFAVSTLRKDKTP